MKLYFQVEHFEMNWKHKHNTHKEILPYVSHLFFHVESSLVYYATITRIPCMYKHKCMLHENEEQREIIK